MQVGELGMRCACTQKALVYHFEGTTTASTGRDDYVRTILENSAKFRQRWHHRLRDFPNDDNDWSWHDRDAFGMSDQLDLVLISP
jgi:hypothetical protein